MFLQAVGGMGRQKQTTTWRFTVVLKWACPKEWWAGVIILSYVGRGVFATSVWDRKSLGVSGKISQDSVGKEEGERRSSFACLWRGEESQGGGKALREDGFANFGKMFGMTFIFFQLHGFMRKYLCGKLQSASSCLLSIRMRWWLLLKPFGALDSFPPHLRSEIEVNKICRMWFCFRRALAIYDDICLKVGECSYFVFYLFSISSAIPLLFLLYFRLNSPLLCSTNYPHFSCSPPPPPPLVPEGSEMPRGSREVGTISWWSYCVFFSSWHCEVSISSDETLLLISFNISLFRRIFVLVS